jgi:hypothetical protein
MISWTSYRPLDLGSLGGLDAMCWLMHSLIIRLMPGLVSISVWRRVEDRRMCGLMHRLGRRRALGIETIRCRLFIKDPLVLGGGPLSFGPVRL